MLSLHEWMLWWTYMSIPTGNVWWKKQTGGESQSTCLCLSAWRWRGLAWQTDWHAGGVLPSLNAAIFCSYPLTSRCHSIMWAQIKPFPQSTDGAGLNNNCTDIISSLVKQKTALAKVDNEIRWEVNESSWKCVCVRFVYQQFMLTWQFTLQYTMLFSMRLLYCAFRGGFLER